MRVATDRWNRHFLRIAREVASMSKDRSTKCGCVLVTPFPDSHIVATGYNGFARGIDDNVGERHERPAKYMWTEHCERNAIYAAAKRGVKTEGCTAYIWTTRNLFSCADCARSLIQAGIRSVIMPKPDMSAEGWVESCGIAYAMLREAGIEVSYFHASLD